MSYKDVEETSSPRKQHVMFGNLEGKVEASEDRWNVEVREGFVMG